MEHLDALLDEARRYLPLGQEQAFADFVRLFGPQMNDGERSTADLSGALSSHFALLANCDEQAPVIAAFNPNIEETHFHSPHSVIEMVVRDRPFLVDTLLLTLEDAGLRCHHLAHSIVEVERQEGALLSVSEAQHSDDRYLAIIYCEIDRQSDSDALAVIRENLLERLRLLDHIVDDWQPMRRQLSAIRAEIAAQDVPCAPTAPAKDEVLAFIDWILAGNFTFLGFREYQVQRTGQALEVTARGGSGLGLLSNEGPDRISKSFAELPQNLRSALLTPQRLLISKSSQWAPVHRHASMDFIGIQRLDEQGQVVGEYRFLGLFTASAYQLPVREIPLLRAKAEALMAQARLPKGGHAWKKMLNVLNNLPRDDFFQASAEELFPTAMGILHLQDKQQLRLFVRLDSFRRFVSALVYVPREKFNTAQRVKIQKILLEAFGGSAAEFSTQFNEQSPARVAIHIRDPHHADTVDVKALEAQLVLALRDWHDDYAESLLAQCGEAEGNRLLRRFARALPAAYCESNVPRAAVLDTLRLDALSLNQPFGVHLYQSSGERSRALHLKLYGLGHAAALSKVLPMLENFGVVVAAAHPYTLKSSEGRELWMQTYDMTLRDAESIALERVRGQFEEAFAALWRGDSESDRLNELVLTSELDWCEVVVLRALSRYMVQARAPFSCEYIQQTLIRNPQIAAALLKLFHLRMNPTMGGNREEAEAVARAEIEALLAAVQSLDEDRILRWLLNLMTAMVRSNFYQRDDKGQRKDRLSFKFLAREIEGLPQPRPLYEIFVYSPKVEAVHLRGGKVARGGLRWSDRMEDFRTEILGLVKAQMVKNAVIVPVGSKGGFIVKTPTANREAFLEEGKRCYQTFIRGMLDITDNLEGGRIVPPKDCARLDGDDPYLVVAADKGTATFSDLANAVAAEYGFWLGDAFASGGSAGYDHKAMGITARGAWESVKRHFRMLGKDVQNRDDIRVIGIGDMSGDVFGNGMLSSRHIRLLAAFNHQHIFIDPNPDAEISFAERERLFRLPRSSWADYNPQLISKGGGVFARSEKAIAITPEMRAAFALEETRLTPAELIQKLLKAPVDLLWNGGIGTYVKHSQESANDVGDRANDALRINGCELRALVVGEGGNLGMTQRGRVEYALAGGRLYTDAIDNSGGVNCSDHEVNLKILFHRAIENGDLTPKQRNEALASMSGEVAALVLRQNYLQPQAIEMAVLGEDLDDHARLMAHLEKQGRLNRALEFLPDEETLAQRRAQGLGLTRPELAVLLAYAKMEVYDALLASKLPDEPYFAGELAHYFPASLPAIVQQNRANHRLHREIICTMLTNAVLNRMGITFILRAQEECGASCAALVRAFALAREVFAAEALWAMLEAGDGRLDIAAQQQAYESVRQHLERATLWFLRHLGPDFELESTAARFRKALADLECTPCPPPQGNFTAEEWAQLSALPQAVAALDVVLLQEGRAFKEVAALYFALRTRLHGEWLVEAIAALPTKDAWSRRAAAALAHHFHANLRALAQGILQTGCTLEAWEAQEAELLARLDAACCELANRDNDWATLSVVLGELAGLNRVAG